MKIEMTCPTCGSHDISKNGTTRRGKQNYKCRDCNRQFVENPQWKPKDKDTRSLVDLLLLEKIPLAGITRAINVSESWLQGLCQCWLRSRAKSGRSRPQSHRQAERADG
jgi:transposase-like protein